MSVSGVFPMLSSLLWHAVKACLPVKCEDNKINLKKLLYNEINCAELNLYVDDKYVVPRCRVLWREELPVGVVGDFSLRYQFYGMRAL